MANLDLRPAPRGAVVYNRGLDLTPNPLMEKDNTEHAGQRTFRGNREALLGIVDEFINADGVVHPAEVKFRNDLAALLGCETNQLMAHELLARGAHGLISDDPARLAHLFR